MGNFSPLNTLHKVFTSKVNKNNKNSKTKPKQKSNPAILLQEHTYDSHFVLEVYLLFEK